MGFAPVLFDALTGLRAEEAATADTAVGLDFPERNCDGVVLIERHVVPLEGFQIATKSASAHEQRAKLLARGHTFDAPIAATPAA